MCDSDTLTWRKVAAEIESIVRGDVESGEVDLDDEEACYEYAWEWADGSEYVIYTHQSRTLWADGLPDGAEDEAADLGPHEDPDAWIRVAVFCAMRSRIMEVLDECRDERDEADGDDE